MCALQFVPPNGGRLGAGHSVHFKVWTDGVVDAACPSFAAGNSRKKIPLTQCGARWAAVRDSVEGAHSFLHHGQKACQYCVWSRSDPESGTVDDAGLAVHEWIDGF